MASSENQGLQIAVIIFILLVVILGVVSVFMFRGYTEATAMAETEAKKRIEADTNLRTQVEIRDELKAKIGFDAETTKEAIGTTFSEDMNRLGKRLTQVGYQIPQDGSNYRTALDHLIVSLESVHATLASKEQEIEQLKQTNAAYEDAKNKELEQFRTQAQTAEANLAAATAKFNDDLRAKDEELASIRGMFENQNQQSVAAVQAEVEKTTVVSREKEDAEKRAADLARELNELTGKTNREFDGEITRSNVATGTVWLNVGSADYLPRRVVFSVFPAGAQIDGAIPSKAIVEVTQILGDHLAEARVIQENPTDPILPGDKIMSDLWKPGRQVRYAIAGRFDLDGDGREDLDRLKNLVSVGGGVIDAELLPDGTVNGSMYVGTTFLILGEPPAERARAAYEQMIADAKRFGTQIISLPSFLQHIGYRNDPRQLVQFGQSGNAAVTPPELPDGGQKVSPGSYSDVFKQRRPPSSIVGGSSAYQTP